MGTVFNRGTRAKPNWYVGYQEHGEWKYRPSRQPTKEQAKRYVAEVEARIARGVVGIEESGDAPMFKALFESFLEGLTNRNADDDRSRGRRHVLPAFARRRLADVTLASVMEWIDDQRKAGEIGEASIRHNMNLLSRFFSWAIARGHATINPVRQIPMGSRPTQTVKSDTPWIEDDAIVRKLIADLEEPISFMFYLGNRSGLRTGEAAGLRMSDFAFLDEGLIRVRFSYDGPLKEDKRGEGKVKWVPAPDDCAEFLGPWLAQRKAQGAGPEDRVFPCARRKGLCFRKEYIEQCWEEAAPKHVGSRTVKVKTKKGELVDVEHPTMTWYEATRHSFVSRHLSTGASLDEVSAAVGHSSPVVTKRFYDHFVRRSFSPRLRTGLGLGAKKSGRIVPMRKSR
ncbi:MAG: site-specific integrase [Kofleriaceae bacterium]|nr:site-specific integrase [Kofleriaceae bacterium]